MRLPILFDCPEPWEGMAGGRRRRHCAACDRDVHDLSARREIEAKALVMVFQSHGLCARYTTDDRGEIQFVKEERRGPTRHRLAARGSLGAGVVALTLASAVGCGPAPALTGKPGGASGVVTPSSGAGSAAATNLPLAAVVDSDHDGVTDAADKCPDEPGPTQQAGCPPEKKGPLRIHQEFGIESRIFFRFGGREIRPSALILLKEVAAVLRANPDITQIEVQGNASPDEPRPQQLSEDRAQAVRAALVAAKVEPSRLTAAGYGAKRPLNDNSTRPKREINRRIEFVIVHRESSKAPAPPG